MYKTHLWDEIKEVDILYATEEKVYFLYQWGKKDPKKLGEADRIGLVQYHFTFDDARIFLLQTLIKRSLELENKLEKCNTIIKNLTKQ